MTQEPLDRREFLGRGAVAAGGLALGLHAATATPAAPLPADRLHVACNQYPWITYYRREGRDFNADLDRGLGELAASGLDGYEPIIGSPEEAARLGPLLRKHGLEMRSFYVNSTLHEAKAVEESTEHVLRVAAAAKRIGARIVVTNPSPLQWSREGARDKTDEQLRVQGRALNALGRSLREMGMTLSYHNHDMELRQAAREFHHMLVSTDPENVTFCLDSHWVYRGSGNSSVALFDVVKLYGKRVTELHLRQSRDHVWTETFGEGDIDYPALVRELRALGIRPHLVLEQAVEDGTPKTMATKTAHERSAVYARKVFAGLGG